MLPEGRPWLPATPVDRGKPRSKINVLSDRSRISLTALASVANTYRRAPLVPLLDSLAPIRSRRGVRFT